MASLTNEYQKYLNNTPNETSKSSSLLKIAVAGAGLYGFHRAGGTSLAARYLAPAIGKTRTAWETSSALGKAIDEALEHRSILSMFNKDTMDDIAKSFEHRMVNVHRNATSPLGGKPTEIVRRRMEIAGARSRLTPELIDSMRVRDIMKEIETHTQSQESPHIFDAIKPHLINVSSRNFWLQPHENAIRELVGKSGLKKKNDIDFAQKVIADAIKNQYDRFATQSGVKYMPTEIVNEIKKASRTGSKILEDEFKQLMKTEDTFFTRLMARAGYKQATVGDLVKQGYFDNTQVHRVGRDFRTQRSKVISQERDWNKKFAAMMEKDPEIAKLRADKMVFIGEDGKLVDLRHVGDAFQDTLGFLANNFQIPFVNINPLRLAHWISYQGVKNAPFYEVLQRGTIQPALGSSKPLERDLMAVGSKVYDFTTGDLVKENVYLASGRFGLFPRALAGMTGLERAEVVATREKAGWFKRLADFGMQDSQGDLSKITSVLTKPWNPKWARNQYNYLATKIEDFEASVGAGIYPNIATAFVNEELNPVELVNAYRAAYNLLSQKTGAISAANIEKISSLVADNYGMVASDFAARTGDEVMETIGKMMSKRAELIGEGKLFAGSPVEELLRRYVDLYYRDPVKFANSPRVLTDEFPTLPGITSVIESEGSTKLIQQFEDARKAMQMDLIYQLQAQTGGDTYTVASLLKGRLVGHDLENAEGMMMLNQLRGEKASTFNKIFRPNSVDEQIEGLGSFISRVADPSDSWLVDNLGDVVKKHTPWWGAGPGWEPPDHFGRVRSLVINKTRSPLEAVNEAIKQGKSFPEIITAGLDSTVGQLGFDFGFGFRAGRKNLDKISTATVVSYYMFGRLNEALAKYGLGLSNKSLGSAQDVFANLVGRRFLLPLAVIGYAGYGNELIDQITGINPKETVANAYVGAKLDMARLKDTIGITGTQKRYEQLLPGIDQVREWTPVKALGIASFGLIGDSRSRAELEEYFATGMDPIRSGRYWGIGSNTPWSGGRIDYFAPNWYRRTMTDYMMSDVMYGSRSEYYANQWYPTLSNPLGPIKSIFIDPHHWANKHREDRPYPSTGGATVVEELPIFGPMMSKLLDTMGLVPDIKRGDLSKAHREYIKDINEAISGDRTSGQGYIYRTPAGGTALSTIFPELGSGDPGIVVEPGTGGIPISGGGGAPINNIKDYTRAKLEQSNQAAISRAAIRSYKFGRDDLVRNLEDVMELDEPVSPSSLQYRSGETWYSLSEMAGIYGFIATQLTGGENRPYSKNVLASSTYMNSFGRSFWDMNLGGFGGMVSEIFRRFAPNNKYRREQYNPYRNQMPDWLPGPAYFTDFLHGDPYCVSKDTLIEISELNFIRADSVGAGDIVTTHTGVNTPVINSRERAIKQGEKVYRFKVASLAGTIQEFSEEHPILVSNLSRSSLHYNNKTRRNKLTTTWKMAKDIQVGDYIAYPRPVFNKYDIVIDMHDVMPNNIYTNNYVYIMYPCSQDFAIAYEWLEKHPSISFARGERKALLSEIGVGAKSFEAAQASIKNRAVPNRINRFITINENIAYMCGIYLAEGSLSDGCVSLAHNVKEKPYSDRAIVGAFEIHPRCKCTFKQTKGTNGAYTIISSTPIRNFLEYLFCSGHANKYIPNLFAHANQEVTAALLKGLFDGDGSLYYDKGSSEFSNIEKYRTCLKLNNKKLLLQVRKLLLQYGIVFNINSNYGIARGSVAVKLAEFLGYNVPEWIVGMSDTSKNSTWTIVTEDYIYCRVIDIQEITSVDIVYGFEVGIDNSFCTAGIATHNTKIPMGEARLPGAGYERLNRLHPDELGEYGALDRFKILADVAPYSEEYKLYRDMVVHMDISEQERKEVSAIKKQVSEKKKKYRMYPYKFASADISKEEVTVTRIIDANTFMTAEYPDHPFRLAGIHVPVSDPSSEEARAEIARYIYPGATVKVGLGTDQLKSVTKDVMGTMHAVVYTDWDTPLQAKLIRTLGDQVTEKETDFSAVGVRSRFYQEEITVGKLWERFAHMDTPFHCVAPWTEIITANGIVEAKNLEKGDLVLTHAGRFKPVVDVRPQGSGKRIVDIKLSSSNIKLTVTDDHPILACRSIIKNKITSRGTGEKLEPYGASPTVEFINAGELKPYDYVVYRPRIMEEYTNQTIDILQLNAKRFVDIDGYIYTKFKGGNHRKKIARYIPMSSELARLFGYYASEGCVSSSNGRPYYTIFTFESSETEYIDDVVNIVRNIFDVEPRIVIDGHTCHIWIGSAFLSELMSHYVGNKKDKIVPEELLTNRELRAQFIRGLFRGDGTKAGYRRYDAIGIATINVLLWTRDALFNLWHIPASIAISAYRDSTLYALRIGKYIELAEYIDSYNECPNKYFKQEIQTGERCVVGDYIFYRISSVVESVYQEGTIDIEVEDDDTFATLNAHVHNTKFLNVRSPLEQYKRTEVYGKQWQPWYDPWGGILKPTLESFASKNPLLATAYGAVLGRLFGSGAGLGKKLGTVVGGITAGTLAAVRVFKEGFKGETWIPERRVKEREINEYFDILKYLKYKGLYERFRDEARQREGVDVAKLIEEKREVGDKNKERRNLLKNIKRKLKIENDDKNKDELKRINQELKTIDADRELVPLGPFAIQALYYDLQAKSTLYGADELGEMVNIFRALPKKDREFYPYFINATPEEREEILRLVPKNQRRLYQARWGMEMDEKVDLSAYFKTHYLPDANWEGWRPDVSLEDIKYKVVKNEALEATEFGFWPDDEKYADRAPEIQPFKPSSYITSLQPKLMRVLRGSGLRNIDIKITHGPAAQANSIDVQLSVEQDRSNDIVGMINRNIGLLL